MPPEKLKEPVEPATPPVVSEFTASSPAIRLIVPVPEVLLPSLPPRLLLMPLKKALADAPSIVRMPVPPLEPIRKLLPPGVAEFVAKTVPLVMV